MRSRGAARGIRPFGHRRGSQRCLRRNAGAAREVQWERGQSRQGASKKSRQDAIRKKPHAKTPRRQAKRLKKEPAFGRARNPKQRAANSRNLSAPLKPKLCVLAPWREIPLLLAAWREIPFLFASWRAGRGSTLRLSAFRHR
jgi:hypothetical protein